MPALSQRHAPLCLFCAAAAARTRPRLHSSPTQRLQSHVQAAYHSNANIPNERTRQKEWARKLLQRPSDNPLRKSRISIRPLAAETHFFAVIRKSLSDLRIKLDEPVFLESLQLTSESFNEEWVKFDRSVTLWIKDASPELRSLAAAGGAHGSAHKIQAKLRYMFYAQVCGGRFTQAELENQKHMADLRYPEEWYPATREIARTVHLHVGPTNSGKTYHALKRLEEAKRGIYLGPLRLLAHEVYTRLRAKGKSCALVTGEEQRVPEGEEVSMWSCTVEMAPMNTPLDVAVIDEIQMINHKDRGWAWTQAFLGIQAKEVHLCGEARTVPLIKELCALIGDKVHVHEYNRLTTLAVAHGSLRGDLTKLEKGDCIVAFTVLGLHALRREVEQKTGRKCAIVYGGLPPETRAQQARLFNDPDNDYDFLVASDAIGMGLNLSIKRVIFESTMKHNGTNMVPLEVSEIKQIGGRAGRFKTAQQAIARDSNSTSELASNTAVGLDDASPPLSTEAQPAGIVTTLDRWDHQYMKDCMKQEPEPIRTAGIFPPGIVLERFASYFPPGTPFSYIMLRLNEVSKIHSRFHLCTLKDQLKIADVIHTVKNLTTTDRSVFCAAPANMRETQEKEFFRHLAECVADARPAELLSLPHLPLECLDDKPSDKRSYLFNLEQLHKQIVIYLWLSYRFPNIFISRDLASYVKQLTEEAIERTLSDFSYTEQARKKLRELRKAAMRDVRRNTHHEQQIPVLARQGVPQEFEDIINHSQSFAEDAATTDDEGRYHPEELELMGPASNDASERLRSEVVSEPHQQAQKSQSSFPPQDDSTTANRPRL